MWRSYILECRGAWRSPRPLRQIYQPHRHVHSKQEELSKSSLTGWETVIGLEIHTQIKTDRKLFSRALTSWEELPNSNVAAFDAAFPGTLPVLNKNAVRLTLMSCLALKCTINPRSTFDRKHYFYHDIPASYQITQHYNPIATGGFVAMSKSDPGVERDFHVGIQQVQIEQDTAKSSRASDGSTFIDLNRAGSGLMEIVTDADMRSPEEAGSFLRKLQLMLKRLGASDGDMEKGSLRVDANVSIHRTGTPFQTRCEIKNLNSVRFMQMALDFERRRHLQFYLANPGKELRQETRGFNEASGETFTLRTKEDAEDYRYMPDPNLPAVLIAPEYLQSLADGLPELADQALQRLPTQYGLSRIDVDTLLGLDEEGGDGVKYFEQVVNLIGGANQGKKVANWIVHELLGQLAARGEQWTADTVDAAAMAGLVERVDDGRLTGSSAKVLLKHLLATPDALDRQDIDNLITALHLGATGEDSLRSACEAVIANLPEEAQRVRDGNEKVVMRLVGQVMKDTRGRADAKRARETLLGLLGRG